MKIGSLMTPDPVTCLPSTNLAEAASLMLKGDCGILPVVDQGKLRGVVTDRDLFIAVATRNTVPSSLTVGEVMQRTLYTCGPDDEVNTVLDIMKAHTIRRVPVLGFGGTVTRHRLDERPRARRRREESRSRRGGNWHAAVDLPAPSSGTPHRRGLTAVEMEQWRTDTCSPSCRRGRPRRPTASMPSAASSRASRPTCAQRSACCSTGATVHDLQSPTRPE